MTVCMGECARSGFSNANLDLYVVDLRWSDLCICTWRNVNLSTLRTKVHHACMNPELKGCLLAC